jgi:hypothetical protein
MSAIGGEADSICSLWRLRKAGSTKVEAVAMDEMRRINNIARVLEFLGLMQ